MIMATRFRSAENIEVIIETPKGNRNKYAYDPKRRLFELSRVLPAGMSFPFDFGFVPRTHAEDGDPIDVLVLMDEPAFCGCLVECRLIGVIKGEQTDDGKTVRNDRLVAVQTGSHAYGHVRTILELPEQLVREVGEFFVNYHRLQGRKFRVLRSAGPAQARALLSRSRRAA
jgi:inorganic pyrophosphatase